MRKPILAGNWKMNKTRDAAIHFILDVEPKLPKDNVDVIICAPAILLRDLVKRSDVIKVGAQNMNEHDSGAYTGEISPVMLKDTKVDYVILGHSERRAYYNETDATVNAKIKKALEFELKPIVCVGETLEQRESGKTNDVLSNQIKKAFDSITIENPENVIIAYEPIWAIGTGKSATSKEAQDSCKYIRELLTGIFGEDTSSKIRILYGGSINVKNFKDIIAQEDIDGGLVGGSSLVENDFVELTKDCLY
jgi:triosephosphate isomerase